MTTYQWFGAISIGLLVVALGLMSTVFVGRFSLRRVYWISGTVLTMMIALSVFCILIYLKFS